MVSQSFLQNGIDARIESMAYFVTNHLRQRIGTFLSIKITRLQEEWKRPGGRVLGVKCPRVQVKLFECF
jgi:hypothetical protein